MKLSQNGINLIKNLEGYREKSYKCSAGKLTIGYGHTDGVYEDQKITKEQADNFLKKDVEKFEKNVNNINKKKKYNLNQNQFDSLVSFTFNLGPGKLNTLTQNRTKSQLPDGMKLYNKANKKVIPGLANRRQKEIDLFNKPMGNTINHNNVNNVNTNHYNPNPNNYSFKGRTNSYTSDLNRPINMNNSFSNQHSNPTSSYFHPRNNGASNGNNCSIF